MANILDQPFTFLDLGVPEFKSIKPFFVNIYEDQGGE